MSGKHTTVERRRIRRYRIRSRIAGSVARPRLSVFRSARHIYAQVIDDVQGVTLASASSKEDIQSRVEGKGKVALSTAVGFSWAGSFYPAGGVTRGIAAKSVSLATTGAGLVAAVFGDLAGGRAVAVSSAAGPHAADPPTAVYQLEQPEGFTLEQAFIDTEE